MVDPWGVIETADLTMVGDTGFDASRPRQPAGSVEGQVGQVTVPADGGWLAVAIPGNMQLHMVTQSGESPSLGGNTLARHRDLLVPRRQLPDCGGTESDSVLGHARNVIDRQRWSFPRVTYWTSQCPGMAGTSPSDWVGPARVRSPGTSRNCCGKPGSRRATHRLRERGMERLGRASRQCRSRIFDGPSSSSPAATRSGAAVAVPELFSDRRWPIDCGTGCGRLSNAVRSLRHVEFPAVSASRRNSRKPGMVVSFVRNTIESRTPAANGWRRASPVVSQRHPHVAHYYVAVSNRRRRVRCHDYPRWPPVTSTNGSGFRLTRPCDGKVGRRVIDLAGPSTGTNRLAVERRGPERERRRECSTGSSMSRVSTCDSLWITTWRPIWQFLSTMAPRISVPDSIPKGADDVP